MSIARILWHHVRMEKNAVKASGKGILVPPGIAVRPMVRGDLELRSEDAAALEPGQEIRVTFRLEYSESKGCFEVAAFGIDRLDADLEVSGAFLRTVRVHAITKLGILAAVPEWAFQLAQLRNLRERGGLRSFPEFAPSDDDALLLTALIYRIAEISGENPALAVAESIGLKQRTATNWIQRARGAGYMTSTEHSASVRRVAESIKPFWSTHIEEDLDAMFQRMNVSREDVRALVERELAEPDPPDGEASHGND